jgi:PAS domain S-box-containing protein
VRGFLRDSSAPPQPAIAEDGKGLESAVLANVAAGVTVVDAENGEIIYTNACWDRMFGYAAGELLGRHIAVVNAATDETPESRSRAIFDALARDGAWSGEMHNVRKDGSLFRTSCSISSLERDGHRPAWITVQTDITDRRAAQDRLLDSERRYRRLFETSPAALAMIDGDLRLTLVNEAFADLVGYRPDELQGMLLPDLTHPEDIPLCTELRQRVVDGATAHYRLEERLVTRQGGVVPVAFSATVVRGPDGSPECEIAVIEPLRPSRI